MGGTFDRLIKQGHDVHVAYHTSGNVAVKDSNVLAIAELIKKIALTLNMNEVNYLMNDGESHLENKQILWTLNNINNFHKNISNLITKEINIEGYKIVNKIKGTIRQSEAHEACRYLDLNKDENIHYLDMPFYQTGTSKKKDIGDSDITVSYTHLTLPTKA